MDNLKRIMIVDDEPSILLSFSHILKGPGVEVVACQGLEQAKEELGKNRFDLVITDIRLSSSDGFEGLDLLTHIKMRYATDVIVMTGYGSYEMEQKAKNLGAIHYFNKPINIPDLLKVVAGRGILTKGNYGDEASHAGSRTLLDPTREYGMNPAHCDIPFVQHNVLPFL